MKHTCEETELPDSFRYETFFRLKAAIASGIAGRWTKVVLKRTNSANIAAVAPGIPNNEKTRVEPPSLKPNPAMVGVGMNSIIVINGWRKK
jgi:hypothetical protein